MSTVSFAKVAGAGSSAPVSAPAPQQANAEVVPPDENSSPRNLPAVAGSNVNERRVAFYTGADDDDQTDENAVGRAKRPYLNLVQPTSKDIKSIAPEGDFVLAKRVKIPAGSTAVFIGFGKTFFREKVKWGSEGRTFYSLEEVEKAGCTPRWYDSKENEKGTSRKPWAAPSITALLFIEKPEGADEAFFPYVVEGKAYTAALAEFKSSAYDSVYTELNSLRKTTALFKSGWASRFVKLKSQKGKGEDASFKPVPEVLGATPAAFIELAKTVASE